MVRLTKIKEKIMKESVKLLNSFIEWWNPPVKPKRRRKRRKKNGKTNK